jgi:hypothetical protein
MVVLTDPTPGLEDDYNQWYERHVAEVLTLKGVVAAQRFRLVPGISDGDCPHGYLAIYEIEGDVAAAKAAVAVRRDGTPWPPDPTSLSPAMNHWWFTAITDRELSPANEETSNE